MLRLTQILRNFFLRLEGFFSVVFKPLFNFVRNLFGFFASAFGFTQSDYFLESDEAQGTKQAKQAKAKESVQTPQNATFETPATTRRRPNTKKIDDYYINMARDVKKS